MNATAYTCSLQLNAADSIRDMNSLKQYTTDAGDIFTKLNNEVVKIGENTAPFQNIVQGFNNLISKFDQTLKSKNSFAASFGNISTTIGLTGLEIQDVNKQIEDFNKTKILDFKEGGTFVSRPEKEETKNIPDLWNQAIPQNKFKNMGGNDVMTSTSSTTMADLAIVSKTQDFGTKKANPIDQLIGKIGKASGINIPSGMGDLLGLDKLSSVLPSSEHKNNPFAILNKVFAKRGNAENSMTAASQPMNIPDAALESKEQNYGTKKTNPIDRLIGKMSKATGINVPESMGNLLNMDALLGLLPSSKQKNNPLTVLNKVFAKSENAGDTITAISQPLNTVDAPLKSKEQNYGTKKTNPIDRLIGKMSKATGINVPKSMGDVLNMDALSGLLPSSKQKNNPLTVLNKVFAKRGNAENGMTAASQPLNIPDAALESKGQNQGMKKINPISRLFGKIGEATGIGIPESMGDVLNMDALSGLPSSKQKNNPLAALNKVFAKGGYTDKAMNPISQAFSTVNASLESKEQDQGTKRTNPINQLIEKMSETTKGINLPKSIGDLLNPNKLSSLLPSFKGEDKESGVQLETNKINLNRANPMLSEMQTQGIRFEKFCEQLIIQTPEGTPAESANYIVKEIMRKINGGFDGL